MSGAWVVTARTDDGHELRFEWNAGPLGRHDSPGALVAAVRTADPTPVKATPTGPVAPPCLDGPSWVAYCTVVEAFSRVARRGTIRSDGDPEWPVGVGPRAGVLY